MNSEALWNGSIATILCVTYFLLYLTIRWNLITRPSHKLLQSTIRSIESDINTTMQLTARDESDESIEIKNVIDQARCLLKQARDEASQPELLDKIFGYRGQLLSAWQLVHKAKRVLVSVLSEPQLIAQLLISIDDLRETGQPRAIVLADRITSRLGLDPKIRNQLSTLHHGTSLVKSEEDPTQTTNNGSSNVTVIELKVLLQEALTIVFDDRDRRYANDDSSQSKAMLMMVTAILLIVMLAMLQNAILLLLGAIGGFVSRLSRSLRTEASSTEYATHWTGLFLSPLAGALGGWVGVLITASLVEKNILSEDFFGVSWLEPSAPFTMALAFLLGFSERFFDQITAVLQDRKPV